MTQTVVSQTDITDSYTAGRTLGGQIAETLPHPDVVILFAAPTYTHTELLQALKQTCEPKILVGCSSSGEFTTNVHGVGMACAVALSSSEMQFTAAIGRDLQASRVNTADEIISSFRGTASTEYRYHTALVLADALAGHVDDLIEQLTWLSRGSYQFFGGGAGDNAQFARTPVFYDTEVVSNAVVALEICSNKPLGLGSYHGWRPNSTLMQVTEAEGMCVKRIDGRPAVEAFQIHAELHRQPFDPREPLPFFLHNLIGIDMGLGYKLRVPLSVDEQGGIICAAEVPAGTTICFMGATTLSAAQAAENAIKMAQHRLYGGKPVVALFFDCVATRLSMGEEFGMELETIDHLLSPVCFAGCNTHGQIVRAEGQFSGFHNCTAIVCLIPD